MQVFVVAMLQTKLQCTGGNKGTIKATAITQFMPVLVMLKCIRVKEVQRRVLNIPKHIDCLQPYKVNALYTSKMS